MIFLRKKLCATVSNTLKISKNTNIRCQRNISFHQLSKWYQNWWHLKPEEPPFDHIVQIGDPVLRSSTNDVPQNMFNTKELTFLIKHMKKVMNRYKSVGLSAPQIGLPYRVMIVEFAAKCKDEFKPEVYKSRQMETIPFTVFINPSLKVLDYDKVTYPEACESIRGFSADVPRYLKVQCTALNEKGEQFTKIAEGWFARIIQHEMDHLDGKLYTDIMNRKSLICTCWHAVNIHNGKINLPFRPK